MLGVGAATVGIIAAPVADSLVKEGKFPGGLGAVVSTLWGWFTMQVSFSLWLALLLVALTGLGLRALLRVHARKANIPSPLIAKLNRELQTLANDKADLEVSNAQLKLQIAALVNTQETQQSRNAALEVEHRAIEAKYNDVQRELVSLRQAQAAEADKPIILDFAYRTLLAIVELSDRHAPATLHMLRSAMGCGQVETLAAIEILLENKMIEKTENILGTIYKLSANGRAYYLEQKTMNAG